MRRLRSWWRLRRDTALGAAEAEIVTLVRVLAERTDALGAEIARRVEAEARAAGLREVLDKTRAELAETRTVLAATVDHLDEARRRKADTELRGGR